MSQPTNLTPMKAVTEMRAVIDAFAAGHAARRIADGADAEPLLSVFDALDRAARRSDYERFITLDRQLHLTVVELAGVEGLDEVWRTIASRMQPFHVETVRACWPELTVLFEAHRPIVDAVCDADPPAAEDAARLHLDAVWYRLAEHTDDPSLPADPLSRATAYIDFHLDQPLRLSFLARHIARTSEGHLARLFRARLGRSYTDYLRELRLQKAADRLRRTHQPIKRIASSVGYPDASRFSQHFARRFGTTPSSYRRRFADG